MYGGTGFVAPVTSTSAQFVSAVEKKQACPDCKTYEDFAPVVLDWVNPSQGALCILKLSLLCCMQFFVVDYYFRWLERQYPLIISAWRKKVLLKAKHEDFIPRINAIIDSVVTRTPCACVLPKPVLKEDAKNVPCMSCCLWCPEKK